MAHRSIRPYAGYPSLLRKQAPVGAGVVRAPLPDGHYFKLRREALPEGAIMFGGSQRKQLNPTVQPANGGKRMKILRALAILQLLIDMTISFFLAGIVIPSFLRSSMATNHDLAAGSLHTLTIAGITFSYTFQNLAFAILGGLFGAAVALAIDSPDALAKVARILGKFRHAH